MPHTPSCVCCFLVGARFKARPSGMGQAHHEQTCYNPLLHELCVCCRLSQCSRPDSSSSSPKPGVGTHSSAGWVGGELQSEVQRRLCCCAAHHECDCYGGRSRQHHRSGPSQQQLSQTHSAVLRYKFVFAKFPLFMPAMNAAVLVPSSKTGAAVCVVVTVGVAVSC